MACNRNRLFSVADMIHQLYAIVSRRSLRPISTIHLVHVTANRVTGGLESRDSILFRWRCDTLCTSGFMVDVTFVHNGP